MPTPRMSRRALTQGVGWSVPALAVSAAAPALALSCPEEPEVRIVNLKLGPSMGDEQDVTDFTGSVDGEVPLPAETSFSINYFYDIFDDSDATPAFNAITLEIQPDSITAESDGPVIGTAEETTNPVGPSDGGGGEGPDPRGAWRHTVRQWFTLTTTAELPPGTDVAIIAELAPLPSGVRGDRGGEMPGSTVLMNPVYNDAGCLVSGTTVVINNGGAANS